MSVPRTVFVVLFLMFAVNAASAAKPKAAVHAVPRAPRPPSLPCNHESMVTITLGGQTPRGTFGDLAKPGSAVGLSAGYRVARWLATGVDYNYFRSPGTHNKDVVDLPVDPGTQRPVVITLTENWTVTGLGLYAKAFVFERGRVAPYLRVGAGAYSIRYSQDVSTATATTTLGGAESQSKIGINAGMGLRGRVVSGTSLGVDVLCHAIHTERAKWQSLWTTGVTIGFGPSKGGFAAGLSTVAMRTSKPSIPCLRTGTFIPRVR